MIHADSDGEVFILADTPNGQARFLILGDPASLYVCSDEALDSHWTCAQDYDATTPMPRSCYCIAVVTGSTAPRAALEPETLAELHRLHVAGFASRIQ